MHKFLEHSALLVQFTVNELELCLELRFLQFHFIYVRLFQHILCLQQPHVCNNLFVFHQITIDKCFLLLQYLCVCNTNLKYHKTPVLFGSFCSRNSPISQAPDFGSFSRRPAVCAGNNGTANRTFKLRLLRYVARPSSRPARSSPGLAADGSINRYGNPT